jgi:hypothetical protein
MNIQINISAILPRMPFTAYHLRTHIDGKCFTSTISQAEVDRMLADGIIKPVTERTPALNGVLFTTGPKETTN